MKKKLTIQDLRKIKKALDEAPGPPPGTKFTLVDWDKVSDSKWERFWDWLIGPSWGR